MDQNELLRAQEKGLVEIADRDITEGEEIYGDDEIIQLVSFMIDDVEYGINILSVHEILRIPSLTRLPNTPDFIKGVINLRGNVIPVVDARIRFGFPVAAETDLTRIIVIQTGEKKIGLMVDNVHQVVRIPRRNVDEPSRMIEGVSEEFIYGIGRLSDRLIVILNLDNIIFLDEELRDIE